YPPDHLQELLDLGNKMYRLTRLYDYVKLVKSITVTGGSLFVAGSTAGKAANVVEAFSQLGVTLVRQKRLEMVNAIFKRNTQKAYDLSQVDPRGLSFEELLYLATYTKNYTKLQELLLSTYYDLMGDPEDRSWLRNLWIESKSLLEDLSKLVGIPTSRLKTAVDIGIGVNKLYEFGEAAAEGDAGKMILSFVEVLFHAMDMAIGRTETTGKLMNSVEEIAKKALELYQEYEFGAKTAKSVLQFLLELDFSGIMGFEMGFPTYAYELYGVTAGVNWVKVSKEPVSFSVHIRTDPIHLGEEETLEVEEGFFLERTAPQREGYRFLHWDVDDSICVYGEKLRWEIRKNTQIVA
ncbi:MAG TPA: hypothetical protein PLF96_14570, partial [Thermotogota bacterium]|nr:hypothetical protein [Thermotogota bacterium]